MWFTPMLRVALKLHHGASRKRTFALVTDSNIGKALKHGKKSIELPTKPVPVI